MFNVSDNEFNYDRIENYAEECRIPLDESIG